MNSSLPDSPTKSEHYRPDIDGLRALAIITVIIFHAFPDCLKTGFLGVDIFFVISGYLLTQAIMHEKKQKAFTYILFYARRIRRLFPALFLMLFFATLFGLFALLPHELMSFGQSLTASVLFLQNIHLFQMVSYFDGSSELKPLLHIWSLGVEEQFYLLWPLIITCFIRSRVPIKVSLIVLILISFISMICIRSISLSAAFYLLPFRLWELALGGYFAASQQSPTNRDQGSLRSMTMKTLLSYAGLALIILGFWVNDKMTFPDARAMIPVFGAGLIISGSPASFVNRYLLSNRLLVYLGLISYPLYLWHWPILSFSRIVQNNAPSTRLLLLGLALSLFLAVLTYEFWEKPLGRNYFSKDRLKTRPSIFFSNAAFLIGVSIASGAALILTGGLPGRYPAFNNKNINSDPMELTRGCPGNVGKRDFEFCMNGESPKARIALIGDSHAAALYRGFNEQFPEGELILAAHGGVPPLLLGNRIAKNPSGEDFPITRARGYLDFVLAKPAIHTVLILSRGPYYYKSPSLPSANYQGPFLRLWDKAGTMLDVKQEFFEGYAQTIQEIVKTGKRPIIIVDAPELTFSPAQCSRSRPFQFEPDPLIEPCGVPRSFYESRIIEQRKMWKKLSERFPTLRIIDPIESFCDKTFCSAMKDGQLFYQDDNHLSYFGSIVFGRIIKDWLSTHSGE